MNWNEIIAQEQQKDYFKQLMAELDKRSETIYPPIDQWYYAFEICPFENTNVVIIGQDPYINENQAHGLAFSVLCEKTPASLLNIKKELQIEFGYDINAQNNLTCWGKQGVLLLNRVLTVDAKKSNSHRHLGWEKFTATIIKNISDYRKHVVFILLGKPAQECEVLIDTNKHSIIKAVHPSPLSAYRGFFNSNIFKNCNERLKANHQQEINWEIV